MKNILVVLLMSACLMSCDKEESNILEDASSNEFVNTEWKCDISGGVSLTYNFTTDTDVVEVFVSFLGTSNYYYTYESVGKIAIITHDGEYFQAEIISYGSLKVTTPSGKILYYSRSI